MDDKVAVYLTPIEAEKFKSFCAQEQSIEQSQLEHQNWKQLKDLAANMQYGVFTNVVIKDGLPVRMDAPMQTVVLGIKFK